MKDQKTYQGYALQDSAEQSAHSQTEQPKNTEAG